MCRNGNGSANPRQPLADSLTLTRPWGVSVSLCESGEDRVVCKAQSILTVGLGFDASGAAHDFLETCTWDGVARGLRGSRGRLPAERTPRSQRLPLHPRSGLRARRWTRRPAVVGRPAHRRLRGLRRRWWQPDLTGRAASPGALLPAEGSDAAHFVGHPRGLALAPPGMGFPRGHGCRAAAANGVMMGSAVAGIPLRFFASQASSPRASISARCFASCS